MKTYHILNLGAGVQSTALYLMSMRRDEPDHVPVFDLAIFGDTGDEPASVYGHLEWLESLGGPPILRGAFGNLGRDAIHGHHRLTRSLSAKRRPGEVVAKAFNIPAYVLNPDGSKGRLGRQCTKEYKINVVERLIRDRLGVPRGRPFPPDIHVVQYFGLSFDEPSRVIKVKAGFQAKYWSTPRFPLFDIEMTRGDCRAYNEAHAPHEVPQSACIYCPFRRNAGWRAMRDESPSEFESACRFDESLRSPGAAIAADLDGLLFLHDSLLPLREAAIDEAEDPALAYRSGLASECEGMCGL